MQTTQIMIKAPIIIVIYIPKNHSISVPYELETPNINMIILKVIIANTVIAEDSYLQDEDD